MVTNAPEWIFAAPPYDDPEWSSGAGEWDVSENWAASQTVKYIRADLIHEAILAGLRIATLTSIENVPRAIKDEIQKIMEMGND